MAGLFSTPDEIAQAQQAQQETTAHNFGALSQEGAGPYLGMRAGQQLGGLLSGPNPAMVRSVLVQDALKEVGQGDTEIGTPKYFQALTKALSQRKLANDALSVQEYGAKLEATAAKGGLERAQALNQLAQAEKALRSPALADLPEAEKFRVLYQNEKAKGENANPETLKFYEEMLKNRMQTEKSPQQEMTTYLQELRGKLEQGYRPTPAEWGKAKMAYNTIVAAKIDPGSGAMIQPPAIDELNPYTNFGIGGAPGAAAPKPGAGAWTYRPGQVKPGEGEIKVLSEGDALKGHLQDLDKLYSKDYVGPIAGRIGYAVGATVGNEPARADFVAQANLYKNRLIKFITGAQMSEVETKRLINEIPDPLDPPSTFEAKRKISEKNIDYVTKAYQQNMRQGGIRQIGGNPVSPNAPAGGTITVTGPNDPAYLSLPPGSPYMRPGSSVPWIKQ